MKRMGLVFVASMVSTVAIAGEPAPAAPSAEPLLKQYACIACHQVGTKVVGPAYKDVAAKYRGNADAEKTLIAKVKAGGVGNWGQIPMPPNPTVPDADLKSIIDWILALK